MYPVQSGHEGKPPVIRSVQRTQKDDDMTPFLFSLMLLRQRVDAMIAMESRKSRPNPIKLGLLELRRIKLARRARRSLNDQLLVAI